MNVQLSDFETISHIGDGGFSAVFLVKKRSGVDKNKCYALKIMRKSTVVKYDMQHQVLNELKVGKLVENSHFFTKMYYAFNTPDKLYIAFDYVSGGQLREAFGNIESFPQEYILFYMAEVIIAIEYLHKKGWFHGDVKIDNILIDADGHVKLIDFGNAKEISRKRQTADNFGTPGYLAPEIIENEGYDENVDWWALGVVVYIMLYSDFPFLPGQIITEEIIEDVLNKEDMTEQMKFVLKVLLQHEPRNRKDIKDFLHDIDWVKLANKEIEPPYSLQRVIPKVLDYGDTFKDFSYIAPHLADNITRKIKTVCTTDATYTCDICKKTFKYKSSVRIHMGKKHSKEAPKFACDVKGCKKKYTVESEKRSHMKRKHKVIVKRKLKSKICDICNKEFYNHTVVVRHKRTIHSKKQ